VKATQQLRACEQEITADRVNEDESHYVQRVLLQSHVNAKRLWCARNKKKVSWTCAASKNTHCVENLNTALGRSTERIKQTVAVNPETTRYTKASYNRLMKRVKKLRFFMFGSTLYASLPEEAWQVAL